MGLVLNPTAGEISQRDVVFSRLLIAIKSDETIRIPRLPTLDLAHNEEALLTLTSEDFGGTVGEFRYLFEGEDDLLHLMVTRHSLGQIEPEDAQAVVAFLLPNVPPALFWMKPGVKSHHFYIGHDVLL
jgi:hypothetical protein